MADHPLHEAPVVDGVVRLHRRDDAEPAEPRDLGEGRMLRVLDAEAPVTRAILPGHALEDVELRPDGEIADGMHHHLQPGGVGAPGPCVEVGLGVHAKAAVAGSVGEALQHQRGV